MAEKVEIDVLINTAQTSNNIKELRKTLRSLEENAQNIGDRGSKEFKRIANVIGETRDRLEDLKEDLTAFKGSAVEKFNAGIQVLKERLANLDFKGVGDSLKNLGAVIKANPIGLLVTAVTTLIGAFDDLKNAGGKIGALFTGIGNIIDGAIQLFKDLADAIGLTGFAAEEQAKQIEAANKRAAETTIARYDAEIAYAQKAGKETKDLEIKKQQAILETNRQAIAALLTRQKLNGELTEEEQKQLDELIKSTQEAYKQINLANIEKAETTKKTSDKEKKEIEKVLSAYEKLTKAASEANTALLNALAEGDIKKANALGKELQKLNTEIDDINDTAKSLSEINQRIAPLGLATPEQIQPTVKAVEELNVELTTTGNTIGEEILFNIEKVNDFLKSDLGQGIKQTFDSLAVLGTTISQSIQQAAQEQRDAQIKALEDFDSYEQQKNAARLARKEITEAQFAQIENNARIKSEEKRKQIERQAFERFRRAKRAEIAISLATELAGIAAAASQNPANAATFGGAGIAQFAALSASALIKASANYAAIDSQKPYRRGGILQGASHERGGIKTPYGELEGGEAVINTRSTSLFKPLLSAINEAGGGRKFALGGVLSQQQQIQAVQDAVTGATPQVIKTYVLQSDVADANRQIDRLSKRNSI